MKTKITDALRWCVRRSPEVLLAFFLAALLPMVFLVLREVVRQGGRFLAGPGQYGAWLWDNRWHAVASVVCLVGVAGLAGLLWFNRETIWAVARKLILEALHRKVVLVLLVFFVVLMPILPFVLTTEGTQKSQVQIVLLYSLVLSLVVLSLLAIFMTTASVCSEVERKQIHITDTKPMPRWQFLLGKWFGAIVLCTAVLGVMTTGTYLLVGYVARPPDLRTMAPDEARKALTDYVSLDQEVFVSRKSVVAPLPDVSKQAHEMAMKELEKQTFAWAIHSAERTYTRQLLYQSQTVPPGASRSWMFGGLKPGTEGLVFIVFKAWVSGASEVRGAWQTFRMQEQPPQSGQAAGEARYQPVPTGPPFTNPAGWPPHSVQTMRIPASAVAADGTIGLLFRNTNPASTVIFDIDTPVQVMQREEGFLPNYYRSLAIVMAHVSVLAALGVMAGSLFSFPVASLVAVVLFIGGVIGPWFTKEFVQPDIYAKLTGTTVYVDWAWRTFAAGIMALMPNFGTYSPLSDLVDGRTVGMGHVAAAGAVLFCIKGGLALLVGIYFYSRRELARTTI